MITSKYIKTMSLALASLLMVSACDDGFEELNKNPNGAEVATPNLLLRNAIESTVTRTHSVDLGGEIGSGWVQHMAKIQYTDEDRYIPRVGTMNNTWSSYYAASGKDFQTIIELATKAEHDNYKGIGMTMRTYNIAMLTDLFGDVPYTEAFKGDRGVASPKYDKQEDIYPMLIATLDTANSLLSEGGKEVDGDIMYDGDIEKWKKFTNSMALRLMLRMSGKVDVSAGMRKIVNDPATYPIFTSNDDNATLFFLEASPDDHPIHTNRQTRDDHRISENLLNMLTDRDDSRKFVYMDVNGSNQYAGIPNGLLSSKAAAYGLTNVSDMGPYFQAPDAPAPIMTFAELNFILAEAAKKGYIDGGDTKAQEYYEAGITASFEQFEEPMQAVFDDMDGVHYGGANPANFTTVAEEIAYYISINPYDAANGLQLIAEQKYLALFDQGLQAWFEWRRTGFPVLVPAEDGANAGQIPVRLPYPSDEEGRNSSNVSEAVARLAGGNTLNSKVWWDN
ncbi:SusD/RagB family nutrient-binding outer membrane lipoprotein [Rhodocytophaga rosea]|uniref:SusD/RagB family nutrient-binding outer membrane lipoprotein n=1 Tax=Rhodocytophaga rosea TaxID=2704465 RepID=A0A6C0GNY4_9BACT|nr:SusD/RagB family nutrient-binding outer membrane lipoprotein [Rhodocytophaga rosea]QHT69302.1 SusD/RagB family nutrient-binding outer membrane lipoprotein [Rhodocytophaga rosea]